jgi:hypothetical protein
MSRHAFVVGLSLVVGLTGCDRPHQEASMRRLNLIRVLVTCAAIFVMAARMPTASDLRI